MTIDWESRYDAPLIPDVREAVLLAHGFRCSYTQADLSHGKFDVDHIFPRALGGRDNLANYAPATQSYNRARGMKRLLEVEERRVMRKAKDLAPLIHDVLQKSRGPEGLPRSPIAMRAFSLLKLSLRTTGGRRASGKFLHSLEMPIEHIRWWCSFGEDRLNRVSYPHLQFGVWIGKPAAAIAATLATIPGVRFRNSTDGHCIALNEVACRLDSGPDESQLKATRKSFETVFSEYGA